MKCGRIIFLLALVVLSNGCLLTKAVSVPMRGVGAIISLIPVAGNTAHDAIDKGAETIDKLPF